MTTTDTLLHAYAALRALVDAMPDEQLADLATRYGTQGDHDPAYVRAADRVADAAYDTGRIAEGPDGFDDDTVIGVPDVFAELAELSAKHGHPAAGYALDVAFAILAYDVISRDDWQLITRWWRAAGAPLPALPDRRPAGNVRPLVAVAPGPRNDRREPPAKATGTRQPPTAAGWEPHPVSSIAQRRHRADRLRWWAAAMWVAELPLLGVAAAVAGRAHSFTPLAVGALLMVALGVWAVITAARARRA